MFEVEDLFVKRGYSVEFCNLSQKPSADRDIIVLIDLEEPFSGHINTVRFNTFKRLLKHLNSAGILWIARSESQEPLYTLMYSIARTLRKELSIDFGIFDVDSIRSGIWDALQRVFKKFQRRRQHLDLDPEYEYIWIGGVVNIGRFHWSPPV